MYSNYSANNYYKMIALSHQLSDAFRSNCEKRDKWISYNQL